MRFIIGLTIAALALSSSAFAEELRNQSVIALSASGIGDEAIIAKIQSSEARFDLSTTQMIALKRNGVSGPVIAAMIAADNQTKGRVTTRSRDASAQFERPANKSTLATSRPAGIYLLSNGNLIRLDFNVSGQTKTSGLLGTMLTSGIAATSIKTVLQGESARIQTSDRSPVFYFYLPDAVNHANASSFEATTNSPSSPNEFSLIRLVRKNGNREARVGRVNIGGAKSGVMDKDRIDFRYEDARPGVFTVKPTTPLSVGEYSFVMIGAGGAKLARFFDFSVQ